MEYYCNAHYCLPDCLVFTLNEKINILLLFATFMFLSIYLSTGTSVLKIIASGFIPTKADKYILSFKHVHPSDRLYCQKTYKVPVFSSKPSIFFKKLRQTMPSTNIYALVKSSQSILYKENL